MGPSDGAPGRSRGLLLASLALALGAGVAVTVASLRGRPSVAPPPAVGALPPPSPFFWDSGARPRSLVPLDQIIEGGPPPDGIPPIDHPRFEAARDVRWLASDEPVLALEATGEPRAYPLQILLWHEIVNDTVGGTPVVVTYCPLCNTAITYTRTVRGVAVTFGTSGRLYNSDLVMYDRATRSLWVQFSGTAVLGPLIGTELTQVPSGIVSWAEFRAAHPEAKVLSRDTGFDRPYGTTPYVGYDSNANPFLFRGNADPRLPEIARVVGVQAGGAAKAYPYEALARLGRPAVVDDRLGTMEIAVFFKGGVRSALDQRSVASSRDVGESGVFSRVIRGRPLTFEARSGRIVDRETGSTWDILGRATAGPLAGERLEPVHKVDTFWFTWSVFIPRAIVWTP